MLAVGTLTSTASSTVQAAWLRGAEDLPLQFNRHLDSGRTNHLQLLLLCLCLCPVRAPGRLKTCQPEL